MLFNSSWKYVFLLHFGSLYYSSAIDYSWGFGSYMILPIVNALTAPCFELLLSLCWGISTEDVTDIKTDQLQGKTAWCISSACICPGITPLFLTKETGEWQPILQVRPTCKGTCGKSAPEPQTASDVELANLLPSRKWRQRKVSVLGLLSTFLFFQMLHFASL